MARPQDISKKSLKRLKIPKSKHERLIKLSLDLLSLQLVVSQTAGLKSEARGVGETVLSSGQGVKADDV